ncbi:tRNA pseudouridine synthase B [Fructilactobacillus fructivorans]|nr:tRNA pseudouridine synthase B [Fructilactobacillus fructivorans]
MKILITGIVPLYKPRGMTSFDCVSKIRHIVGQKRVGHSGTLDPNVDGVLPICLGHATKVVDYLMQSGKVYQGTITLGFSTTTEDLDGEIVNSNFDFMSIPDAKIDQTLNSFLGQSVQIPPMFSAVKVNGKRLYEYARTGERVERPKRQIEVKQFVRLNSSSYDNTSRTQTFSFEVQCGKGTYIRTLATDLGRKLGVPAVMSKLTRIQSGGFNFADTVTFDDLDHAVNAHKLDKIIFPISYALKGFKTIILTDEQWNRVKHGGF